MSFPVTSRATRSSFTLVSPERRQRQDGLSRVELVIVGLVFLIAAVMCFTLLVEGGQSLHARTPSQQARTQSDLALEDLESTLSRLGEGIATTSRRGGSEPQRALVFAGSNALAFNADIDSRRGSLHVSQHVALPGSQYRGEGTSMSLLGAETHVYTLDANGDGEVNAQDRYEAPAGVFNPARETATPLDFALFKRIHGWDGQSWGGESEAVAAYLFSDAAAVARVRFPDGTAPRPLFTYWLTEDLDGDGMLDPVECVLSPCGEGEDRAPALYLWGDTDLDGRLSRKEQTVLRASPVGSPTWPGNPLGSHGHYPNSYLVGFGQRTERGDVLQVSDASLFLRGMVVDLTGADGPSTRTVLSSNRKHELVVSHGPDIAIGATLSVSPRTLLRAVRVVELTFQSLAPRTGHEGPGSRALREKQGLDPVVTTLSRTIELPSLLGQEASDAWLSGPTRIAMGRVTQRGPLARSGLLRTTARK